MNEDRTMTGPLEKSIRDEAKNRLRAFSHKTVDDLLFKIVSGGSVSIGTVRRKVPPYRAVGWWIAEMVWRVRDAWLVIIGKAHACVKGGDE